MKLKDFLSKYHHHYPRSLVYMLQASEYKLTDYLAWYQQLKDFSRVEYRKRLALTMKSRLLLLAAWLILLAWYGVAISVLFGAIGFGSILVFLLLVYLAPYFLAYVLLIPLLIINGLQWPIESFIIGQAKKQLAKHPGLKIAIAGSFGKTSFREILKTVLLEGKKVAAAPHSYNTPLGISQFIKNLQGDEEIIIFELGEYYPGDVRRLCRLVKPQWGIITGVNEAHLEKFKNLVTTAKTIFELADYIGAGPLYVNGESQLAKERASAKAIVYSRQGVGEWLVENAQTDLVGTKFNLVKGDKKLNISSSLLGLHQVGPLVAAADIADRLGLTASQIEQGLNKTKAFDHRLEPKIDAQGVVTLDDSYNGNPDGVAAVIDFLASLKNHRRWYVTPGLVEMGPKIKVVHQEIGRQLARAGIEKVILVKNSVTPFIEVGLKEANYQGEILWFNEGLVALAALPQLTAAGDVILLQNDWPDQYR